MSARDIPSLRTGLSGPLFLATLATAAMAAIFGLWAGITTISGAVIAPGAVAVEGDPRAVQHLDGGIAAEILVTEGDRVAAGDPLIRLDPTELQTTRAVSLRRLAEAVARADRLEAERTGAETIVFADPDLPFEAPGMTAERAMQAEVFAARAELRAGELEALRARLAGLEGQIEGARAERTALGDQLALLEEEIARQSTLVERNLAGSTQLNGLQQQRAQLAGQIARGEARVTELEDARRTAELEARQADRTFLDTAVAELAKTRAEIEELKLDILTRTARLDRVVLRAPVSGVVHELAVRSPGAVIAPGDTVLQVVPQDDVPLVELRVDPRAIDQVHLGQSAEVMLSSFDPNVAPKLVGTVSRIAADAVQDRASGQTFYKVEVALTRDELSRLGEVAVLPGMPAEAFLKTRDRTVLAYLTQPLTRAVGRAFRES